MNQEEEKKGVDDGQAADNPKLSNLRCYDLPEFSKIRYDGTIQFKIDFYEIQLDGQQFKFTVEGEWLNGKPHGICIVTHIRFRGIMTFTHGITDGPAWLDGGEKMISF